MHKFTASLLIFALLVVTMSFPTKSEAYISAVAPVVAAGPIGPVIAGILFGIGTILSIFGFGGIDCDKLIKDFLKVPGAPKLINSGNNNFGGKFLRREKCVCGKSSEITDLIIVGAPKDAIVATTFRSKIYDYNSIKIGNWLLGKTTFKKVCDYPPAFEIEKVGTSKY